MPPAEVIARAGALRVLNASAVTPHERKDSELRYLRGVLGVCTPSPHNWACHPCVLGFAVLKNNSRIWSSMIRCD